MATVAVKTCDGCGAWETDEIVIARVMVAGPRFDLCPKCRANKIASLTGEPEEAAAWVAAYDDLNDKRRRVVTGEGEGVTGDVIGQGSADDVTPESETIIEPPRSESGDSDHHEEGHSKRSRKQAS